MAWLAGAEGTTVPVVPVGRRQAVGRDCEAPLLPRSMEEQSKKKKKSKLKNTVAVNQSSAVFLADKGSKSPVSICNYSLLKSVSVSFQLCSAVYPSLTSVLCFINVLVYPFVLRDSGIGFLSCSFQTGICIPSQWLANFLFLVFCFFNNSCVNRWRLFLDAIYL